jgi:hypothetical protein
LDLPITRSAELHLWRRLHVRHGFVTLLYRMSGLRPET